MTPTDAYTRFRALPILAQLAAGVGVLVLVLWVTGGLRSAWTHWQDSRTDAKVERLEQRAQAAEDAAKVASGKAAALEAQIADTNAKLEEQNRAILALAEQAAEQERRLSASGTRYRAARSGRAPATAADWERRARELYANE